MNDWDQGISAEDILKQHLRVIFISNITNNCTARISNGSRREIGCLPLIPALLLLLLSVSRSIAEIHLIARMKLLIIDVYGSFPKFLFTSWSNHDRLPLPTSSVLVIFLAKFSVEYVPRREFCIPISVKVLQSKWWEPVSFNTFFQNAGSTSGDYLSNWLPYRIICLHSEFIRNLIPYPNLKLLWL